MAPAAPPGGARSRLCVYNAGFFREARVRRIVGLAGWDVSLGLPRSGDWVGVWGNSPTAPRGEAVAARTGAPILRVEDAFLRSVLPGRSGEPPEGLALDRTGVHYDASSASDIETLLQTHPLDDPALLSRAEAAMERLRYWHLSKYSCWDTGLSPPRRPYVLVIDQTRRDAALPQDAGKRFAEMLEAAHDENPGLPIVLRSHPEAVRGFREGNYGEAALSDRMSVSTDPISPWRHFEAASAVYTVSSTLGFEAILAGHVPRVFGSPFYAGWGLSRDRITLRRRTRRHTVASLFAGAMLLYPVWYDPFRDRLCDLETVIDALAARSEAWRQDRKGWVMTGMSAWKRPHMKAMFGTWGKVDFRRDTAAAKRLAEASRRPLMVWAGKDAPAGTSVTRVEDGFLRSHGLGAALVPPLSLGTDDEGIHFDPSRPSRLERLIAESPHLPLSEIQRALRLRETITAENLSKYNIRSDPPPLPEVRPRILVAGQVEDDAAILRTRSDGFGNADLLRAAREHNPEAAIIYKVHPDVAAGLRPGRVRDAWEFADIVLEQADPAALLAAVDEVWTISSTLGFEALMRCVPVTCLGAPFYAGWGLTRDLGPVPERRRVRPSLDGLVHAALIGYPRYIDPVTGQPCPAEVAAERLAAGIGFKPPGVLGRLQRLKALIRPHAPSGA